MSAPRWKTIMSKAIAEHESSSIIQLATVDASNTPHVRSHVFRAFLAPASPALPLLLTSTDIRTPKVTHIRANNHVELVFWLAHSQEQFRIAGRAAFVHPSETPDLPSNVNWEQKRREMFDGMSGHMKASWCRPTPGSPLPSYDAAKDWPQRLPNLSDPDISDKDKHNLDVALGHFALVVIDPTDVDYVELKKIPNQRTHFKRNEEGWVEEIIVP